MNCAVLLLSLVEGAMLNFTHGKSGHFKTPEFGVQEGCKVFYSCSSSLANGKIIAHLYGEE